MARYLLRAMLIFTRSRSVGVLKQYPIRFIMSISSEFNAAAAAVQQPALHSTSSSDALADVSD